MNLYEIQEGLEKEMLEIGRLDYYKKTQKSKDQLRETETGYGKTALKTVYEPVTQALEQWYEDATSGKFGRNYSQSKTISNLNLDIPTIAYLTCRVILDKITRPSSLQSLAITLAGAVEAEAKAKTFSEKYPDILERASGNLQDSSTYERRRSIMTHLVTKTDMEWSELGTKDKLGLGVTLIELFQRATGMINIVPVNRKVSKVVPSKQCLDWIETFMKNSELLAPFKWPMVVPPLPWSGMWTGGYLTLDPIRTPMPFVKVRSKRLLKKHQGQTMPDVYKAVNLIQETPFKINQRVLIVLKHFWNNSWVDAGLPSRSDKEIPVKPDDIKTNPIARKEWSSAAAEIHTWNETTRSKRLQVSKAIWLADKFKEYEAIYFPHQADFRGRLYAAPLFLNPQGPDHVKGLLLFTRGKALGDGDGPGWLAVHMANCFGVDKASFEDRIKWVEDNQKTILECAEDPLGNRFWTTADDPWLFLAGCFEWQGYCREGAAYVCHLPVTMDGSCNGLQNYSAMLRDPVGGAATNLVPLDKPADIYGEVAKVVEAKLREREDDPTADLWLSVGITRKLTKRPVMVMPYGGTQSSTMNYLNEALNGILDKTSDSKFLNDDGKRKTWPASTYLTPVVMGAISEVVVAARAAMDWLQSNSRRACKAGHSIDWVTPDGFFVEQHYAKHKVLTFDTRIVSRGRVQLTYLEETDKPDSLKQANAVAPNFVHSLDATHLRWYVLTAIENGIDNFMVIHDSYGCLPTDVSMMGKCLREAFVDMYTQNDVLEQFKTTLMERLTPEEQLTITPVPPKGSLDLNLVKQSDYFFA